MTLPAIKLVVLKAGDNYKSMSFNDLSAILLKSYESLRPNVLATLLAFEQEGLYCPTVSCDNKQQEIVLTYDSYVKEHSKRKFQIHFSNQIDIEYRYGGTLWIPTTLDGIKKRPNDVKGWFSNAVSSRNATP